jgi:hypothetical protein
MRCRPSLLNESKLPTGEVHRYDDHCSLGGDCGATGGSRSLLRNSC